MRSVLTLREAKPQDLQAVQQRRRQLNALLLVVFILVVAGLTLFSFASELRGRSLDVLGSDTIRITFVGVSVAFALYAFWRERRLARTERALIDERVLSASLSNRLHELSALTREAGGTVALSLDGVCRVILESARELLGATESSVMLQEPETRTLQIIASMGIDPEVARGATIQLGESVAGWVAESLEPVLLQGPVKDPRFRDVVPKDREVRSAISVPLRAGGQPLGVLNVSQSNGGPDYTEHHLRALAVFADQAAIAMENARLFEREKEASDQLAELDQKRRDFLATITHDLKTPLTSILGYVKLLQRMGDNIGSEQAQKFTEIIERQGKRILEMVEQLVVASRFEDSSPPQLAREPLDLRDIVQEQVLAARGMVGERRLDVHMPAEVPTPFGDRSAIEHMLSNLLENAVKYSPEGTEIDVDVETYPGEVRVSVTDEGDGIAEKDLPQIFERYRRATASGNPGSVGLGLFIVRSMATAHGGKAWAENIPGKGARVSFSLPVRSRDA